MRQIALHLLIVAGTSACVPPPHQTLVAPPVDAAAADRLAAFERLISRADEQTLRVSHGRVVSATTDYLILGDGTRVYHAEDLIPVVPADSATARHATQAKEHVDRARPWDIATGIAFVATLVVVVSAPLFFDNVSDQVTFALIGGTAGLATTIALGYKARSEGGDGGDRLSAFTTYNDDLRKRLDVCVDGTRVVACAPAAPAPAAAPPAPAPAPVAPAPAAH